MCIEFIDHKMHTAVAGDRERIVHAVKASPMYKVQLALGRSLRAVVT